MKVRKISTKYSGVGNSEYQPGSRRKVLKNKLNIKRVREMEDKELGAYMKAENSLINKYKENHRFTLKDIKFMHKLFLGDIYRWAGKYRTVNLTKEGFMFASAFALNSSMQAFAEDVLKTNTPCNSANLEEVSLKIAKVHTEFLLIHPFREGNGRTARLLATLMAYQAGYPGIDFSFIGKKGKQFERYVKAVQEGDKNNYEGMKEIIKEALIRASKKQA